MIPTTTSGENVTPTQDTGSLTPSVGGRKRSILGRIAELFVHLFERVMPDPFVFAVILTIVSAILARALVGSTSWDAIAAAWYGGVFNILTFGFQMVLIVVTGYALASSSAVHSQLEKAAALPRSPRSAISLMIVVGMIASWLN